MTSPPRSPGVLFLAVALALVGCGKISLQKLREKNRATIDAAQASYAAMEKAMASVPAPPLDGPCSRPGLVPVHEVGWSDARPDERFGPTGEPDTELLDAAHIPKRDDIPAGNGLFDVRGPVRQIVSDARYAKTPLDFKVDAKRAQLPYDAAAKIRYMIVARTNRRGSGPPADHVDVFLFEHPKGSLVCSFALDSAAERKLMLDNGYDPHTGEPKKDAYEPKPDDLKRLFAAALEARFGITYPKRERIERRTPDDPKVKARAAAVSKALDAAPANLRDCTTADTSGGLRLNKKGLRIAAGEPLLPSNDPNVEIDPTSSAPFATYLKTRELSSAEGVLSAEKWKVIDIQHGGTAASIDGKSYVGGYANGRQVVLDASNLAVCQTKFRIALPSTFTAKTTRTAGGFTRSDIGPRSAEYLRKQLDTELGAP